MGAPFYFGREDEVGGAVYIYMNQGAGLDSGSRLLLTGPLGSGFGMSVAAAGDLNQDGFKGETSGLEGYASWTLAKGNCLKTSL